MEIKKAYYLQRDELLAQWGEQGLSSKEAAGRLEKEGPNKLPREEGPTAFSRFINQLADPMVVILLVAAAISAFLGQWTDSGIIGLVVAVNALLGMYQEGKAAKAAEALEQLHSEKATVLRDGIRQLIPGEQLVVGDHVFLSAGDAAPADLRLLYAEEMQCDESMLTGESEPVNKTWQSLVPDSQDPPISSQSNMVFMGCPILCGKGEGIVTATGSNSSLGKIAGLLSDTGRQTTPLQKRLAGLSRILTIAVCAICALIFLLSVIGRHPDASQLINGFMLAISLAVAAIPEGLVVVVTLVLSLGMKNMSRRKAIIRRLAAVETLGSVQIICTDKTGTLTCNRMSVCRSSGCERETARAVYLCNNAVINEKQRLGSPTELALLDYGERHGWNSSRAEQFPRCGEIPFDSSRKLMTTFHHHKTASGTKQKLSFTKGAPEKVLDLCSWYLDDQGNRQPLDQKQRQQILEDNQKMADEALRVLAAAAGEGENSDPDRHKLVFLGLLGLADPPRPEAAAAVKQAQSAGIKVVMVSGDQAQTAAAIARKLGILRKGDLVISGSQLAEMDNRQLSRALPKIAVFARVLPEDKLRIVRLWQQRGKVTAMTGDGVNDAPALKAADIGCAMGRCGSEVSRRAAHLVLADDNFATILAAVGEGRRIYENIRKAIAFLLSSNLAEVLAIFAASLIGIKLFCPIHLLWINLITDCFPAIALGMEQADKRMMQRPPNDSKSSIFSGGIGWDILWQGALAGALTIAAFAWGAPQGEAVAMSMAFICLSAAELAQAFNMRELERSSLFLQRPNPLLAFSALAAAGLNCLLLYVPALANVFRLAPLSLRQLAISMMLGLAMIPCVELAKLLKRLWLRH